MREAKQVSNYATGAIGILQRSMAEIETEHQNVEHQLMEREQCVLCAEKELRRQVMSIAAQPNINQIDTPALSQFVQLTTPDDDTDTISDPIAELEFTMR